METSIKQGNHVSLDISDDRPSTPEPSAAMRQDLTSLFDQWDREAHAIPRPSVAPDDHQEAVSDVEDDGHNDVIPDNEALALPGDLAAADEPTELAVPESQPERGVAPDDFHAGSGDEAEKARETETADVDDNGVTDLGTETTTPDVNETPPAATTAASSTEASQAGSAAADEAAAADDVQRAPLFNSKALDQLLDESTGDLVALEDFGREVNVRAFESDWFGSHNDISRQAILEQLLRTGEYTAHVDDAGKLLSDPDEYGLADDVNARITVCVHRDQSEDQKREFILRSQTGKRILTYEEQRALKNRLIVVQLHLGVDYESIAKMARVHPNTVRNVENRAAADPNSKLGNTKRPDGRFNPETLEKIAAASKLRAEGKSNPEIAAAFNKDEKTVAKWFKDPPAQGTTKIEDKPDKKAKTRRGASSPQTIKDLAAGDGVPQLHRRVLDRLGQGTQAYIDRLQVHAARTRQEVEAVSDIDEMQDFLLCYSLGLALGELRLRNLLRGGGEIDVEEAVPPSDSSPDKAEHEPYTILLGTVMAIEPHEVLVALPVGGGGVIDNRDNYLDWHAPPKVDEVVRVRVEGFDWRRGLWKLQEVGAQTPAPAPGAIAGSYRDDRCSPDADLAGRKAGRKEMGVTK